MNALVSSPRTRWSLRLALVGGLALAMAALATCLRWSDDVLWQRSAPPFGLPLTLVRSSLLAIGAGAAILATAAFVQLVARRGLRLAAVGGLAAALSVLSLEFAFQFVGRSHNTGYTLASRLWFERHWHPINSLGYRDAEPREVPGKRSIVVVGDSFTAGHGLCVGERFPDRLAALRDDLHVLNLGKNGADTGAEYHALLEYPVCPDAIVLQYYVNDVDGAAQRAGLVMPGCTPYEDIPAFAMRVLVRASYLGNYLYWSWPHTDGQAYVQFLEQAMQHAETLRNHHADLRQFVARAKETHVPLVVVVFPLLHDIAWSRGLTRDVVDLFRKAGAHVIDVADLVADLPIGERMVNRNDAHASARVHERVAAALAAALPR